MSGVVLRCPTCGTNGTRHGECEACGDDEVRYYCEDHQPGLWLDAATCSECGAKFGDRPKPLPKPPTRRATRNEESAARPPVVPTRPEDPAMPPEWKPPSYPTRREPLETEEGPSVVDLVDWIAAELKARGAALPSRELPPVERPPSPPGLPFKGCIIRFLIFVLLLFALGLGAVFLLAGGGIGFLTDAGHSTGLHRAEGLGFGLIDGKNG